jgi:hypothetical protein
LTIKRVNSETSFCAQDRLTDSLQKRALKAFGERDLVDIVDLMAQHTSDGVLLIAFDQQLPTGLVSRLRD